MDSRATPSTAMTAAPPRLTTRALVFGSPATTLATTTTTMHGSAHSASIAAPPTVFPIAQPRSGAAVLARPATATTVHPQTLTHSGHGRGGFGRPSTAGFSGAGLTSAMRGPSATMRPRTTATSSSATSRTLKSRAGTATSLRASQSTAGKSPLGQHCIVAISESRGVVSELGMAAFDLATSECTLAQFSDGSSYVKTLQKLFLLDPVEILLPHTAFDPSGSPSKLVRTLQESPLSSNFQLVPAPRKHFHDALGEQYLKEYNADGDKNGAVHVAVAAQKYYALSALSALMQHIETTQGIRFMRASIRFKWAGVEGTMMIDHDTAKQLELVQNMLSPKSNHSLFGVLNFTLTPMGGRLLRSNIMQPSAHIATIEMRLDAVEELSSGEERFLALRRCIRDFVDVDRLICALIKVPVKRDLRFVQHRIQCVLQLKNLILRIEELYALLTRDNGEALNDAASSTLLNTIRQNLNIGHFEELKSHVEEVLDEDALFVKGSLHQHRINAIKSGYNGFLDVARQTYSEAIGDIQDLIEEYNIAHDIHCRLTYSDKTGAYSLTHAVETIPEVDLLPSIFINVQRKRKHWSFTTLDLMKLNDRVRESVSEVYLMSEEFVEVLVEMACMHLGVLYKASESIALLDMLLALADYRTRTQCVRPEFTDTLAIRNGRHPIREKLQPEHVPNDAYAYAACNFQIVTGPNMSGKSTYLRQIALLQVLAQIGSFIPAEYASIKICDQLFGRLSNDDCLEMNASTFLVEMRDMAMILEQAGERSLVIVDELGRGTSTYDGLGIACAISEKLINMKCLTFFAAHYKELALMLDTYPNVVNLHFNVENNNAQEVLHYTYRVTTGMSNTEHYGIALAKSLDFETSLIEDASEKAKIIELASKNRERCVRITTEELRARRMEQYRQRLAQLCTNAALSNEALLKRIIDLQKEMRGDLLHESDHEEHTEVEVERIGTIIANTEYTKNASDTDSSDAS